MRVTTSALARSPMISVARRDLPSFARIERWLGAAIRQFERLMTHDGLGEDPDPESVHRRFLEWRDEAHFLVIALGHLGEALDAAGIRDLGLQLDWLYIRHLRNAWEHDDDRGLYERDYGARHGKARWRERRVDRLDFEVIAQDLRLLHQHCVVASEAFWGRGPGAKSRFPRT
jgi:hypothetical protein